MTDVDVRACVEKGEHVPSMRHRRADCPVQPLRADHYCQHYMGHNTSCDEPAYTTRNELWLCPEHVGFHDWAARVEKEMEEES